MVEQNIQQHVKCVVGHSFTRSMSDFRTTCPHCRVVVLEKELEEQCRLNGMGAEREMRLLSEVSELKMELARLNEQLKGAL